MNFFHLFDKGHALLIKVNELDYFLIASFRKKNHLGREVI